MDERWGRKQSQTNKAPLEQPAQAATVHKMLANDFPLLENWPFQLWVRCFPYFVLILGVSKFFK